MKILKFCIQNIFYIAISVVIATIVFTKIIAIGQISGNSMNPSLLNKDRIIALRRSKPSRGEIVIFSSGSPKNPYYIKRIIGIPGDSIQVEDDQLYINNKLQPEKYLAAIKKQYQARTGKKFTADFDLFKATKRFNVPVNQYFVLGDNRPNSEDSRSFGFVNRSAIVGVVLLRYYPFNQIKVF